MSDVCLELRENSCPRLTISLLKTKTETMFEGSSVCNSVTIKMLQKKTYYIRNVYPFEITGVPTFQVTRTYRKYINSE